MLSDVELLAVCEEWVWMLFLMESARRRNDRPIGYGAREAMQKIPCAKETARKAFEDLQ